MIHQKPTFTCDFCNRSLGLNFKPIEDILEKERMLEFPLHFCNNNCRAKFMDHHPNETRIWWISMDWPKVTSALR